MPHRQFWKIAMIMVSCCALFLLYTPFSMTKAGATMREIHLSLNPTEAVFDVNDMAPGDVVSATLKIKNKGNEPFSYTVRSEFHAGDQILYAALKLSIYNQGQEVVFEGGLAELGDVQLGSLGSAEETEFSFQILLPLNSGNLLQGKQTTLSFHFVAQHETNPPGEEPPGEEPPVEGPPEEEPPGEGPPEEGPPEGTPPGSNPPSGTPEEAPPADEQPEEISIEEDEIPQGAPEEETLERSTDQKDQEGQNEMVELQEEVLPMGEPLSGEPLPQTSSPWYTWLLIGLISLSFSSLLLWQVKRRSIREQS